MKVKSAQGQAILAMNSDEFQALINRRICHWELIASGKSVCESKTLLRTLSDREVSAMIDQMRQTVHTAFVQGVRQSSRGSSAGGWRKLIG